MAKHPEQRLDPATKSFLEGQKLVSGHPLFAPLLQRVDVIRQKDNYCPADGWAVVLETGAIHVHPTRRGEPEEWAYVIAHCLLHLGFGHSASAINRWTGTRRATSSRRDCSPI